MKFKKNKSYDYLHEFSKLSEFSIEAAEFLDSVLREYEKNNISEARLKMHEIEHMADDAKHGMLKQLIKEFLPPIERDDIISLSHNIDDVTDSIEDVLICFDIFQVDRVYPEVFEFTELIMECTKQMNLALVEFNNYRKSETLFDRLDSVNHLKSKGEAIYVNSLRKLYQASKDPVRVMAYTEIYKRLKKCCEKSKIVTNKVEGIVMKNL